MLTPSHRVVLPPQSIESGTVRLQVSAVALEEVTVEQRVRDSLAGDLQAPSLN